MEREKKGNDIFLKKTKFQTSLQEALRKGIYSSTIGNARPRFENKSTSKSSVFIIFLFVCYPVIVMQEGYAGNIVVFRPASKS